MILIEACIKLDVGIEIRYRFPLSIEQMLP